MVEHFAGGQRPGGDAHGGSFKTVESTSRQQDVRSHGAAGQMRQRPVRHAVGNDAPTHLRDCVFRFFGHDPYVGLQGNRQTDPNGVPVQRLSWLQPAAWTLVFAAALAVICEAFRGGRLVAWGLVAMQLFVVISAGQHEHQEPRLTFAEFFSPGLFGDIRDFIGRSQASYRVACLGLYPAIALYNGFYTADGYWVNYPLEYKHRFRRVIAQELAKDSKLAVYFDEWGSRCYLFSAELGQRYLNTKDSRRRRIEHLDIDTAALAELGTQYILSAVEIGNASELGLKLEKTFVREDSPWQIFLYALPRDGDRGSTVRASNSKQVRAGKKQDFSSRDLADMLDYSVPNHCCKGKLNHVWYRRLCWTA